ncbi:hypothetical protein [Pseudomonas sp. RIT623]|uniref:hypothetical protein n=1 Tax=Pseudomonas sp. RIT623 TaxID=2559075 RepID=UPI0010700A0E|nr:hypothetical protein [Pseudomonas sp. RIT623]TFF38125.1 hypothetical protein E3U47_16910 [Pseudomonas sp. RIT623]
MPTENRSSNTREHLDALWRQIQDSALRSEDPPHVRFAAALLAQPAEQHQGEPVALPSCTARLSESHDWDQGYRGGWRACLDEIAKLGPLYTHADPGEVERLRSCLDAWMNVAARRLADWKQAVEANERQHAKLAERDALLTKMKALFRADDPFDLYDAVCAVLPASAEPRATTPQTINGHKLNCKAVDDYKPGQCSCGVEIDHEIPGTSFQRLNALANQGE